jgi:hypothetical protein
MRAPVVYFKREIYGTEIWQIVCYGEVTRKRGRPLNRRTDEVEEDLKKMGIRN